MESRFLKACRMQPVDCTPVWFMRQAGRYMSEYRAVRSRHSLLEICRTPELAVEVTLQPVDRFDVDAAILFSDLLLPLEPMGVSLEFVEGEGPLIHNPVRSASDVANLRSYSPAEELSFVMEAIRLLRRELDGRVPLIGFAGAPFTLASYIVEGGSSRFFEKTKSLMYSDPGSWHKLASKLARLGKEYLRAQIAAGAQAVQVFDSWVGALSPEDYGEFVLPHSRSLFQVVSEAGVPIIHFGTGNAGLLRSMREAGGDVMGLDWRIHLDAARDLTGHDVAIQGNLDPAVLFAPLPTVFRRIDDILRRAGSGPGHIFNLGHGILPETPVETVAAVVEYVHRVSRKA